MCGFRVSFFITIVIFLAYILYHLVFRKIIDSTVSKAMNMCKYIFVGGCFVEGEWLRNAFRWKETIGPWEERPGHFGDVWMYWTDDGLGHYEFLQVLFWSIWRIALYLYVHDIFWRKCIWFSSYNFSLCSLQRILVHPLFGFSIMVVLEYLDSYSAFFAIRKAWFFEHLLLYMINIFFSNDY